MRVLLLIIFFLIPKLLQAQNDSIVGKVMDRNRTPIEFVTISLLSANDSSLVKGTITDEKGKFILSRKDVKSCIIRVSHIEYKTAFTSVPLSIKDVEFILEPSIISMNEVIVKSNFIRHEYDRIIVNMKGIAGCYIFPFQFSMENAV